MTSNFFKRFFDLVASIVHTFCTENSKADEEWRRWEYRESQTTQTEMRRTDYVRIF